jgi:hypothetical protein
MEGLGIAGCAGAMVDSGFGAVMGASSLGVVIVDVGFRATSLETGGGCSTTGFAIGCMPDDADSTVAGF